MKHLKEAILTEKMRRDSHPELVRTLQSALDKGELTFEQWKSTRRESTMEEVDSIIEDLKDKNWKSFFTYAGGFAIALDNNNEYNFFIGSINISDPNPIELEKVLWYTLVTKYFNDEKRDI